MMIRRLIPCCSIAKHNIHLTQLRLFSSSTGDDFKKKTDHFLLKTAKGTKDFHPYQMQIREKLFDSIVSCFKLHAAVTIDTPVFERKDLLLHKYGEESKLIYDLEDQQGELLSLRYDLTVPFSRYLAMNKIQNIKRYQIGKVYRREQMSHAKGRLREFFQCDFDIAGAYDPMVPDSECLKIVCEVFDKLELGSYSIKVNHRRLLESIYEICGVAQDMFRVYSSSIDKLDTLGWDGVKKHLCESFKIDVGVFESVKEIISYKGDFGQVLEYLKSNEKIKNHVKATSALADLDLLHAYCKVFNVSDRLEFDLSLARGLDYYTGIIFEAVLKDLGDSFKSIGSVAAGGRYDDLVTTLDLKFRVPCVGLSIGVERLYLIMEAKYIESKKKIPLKMSNALVFVATPEKGFMSEKMSICEELWRNGIQAEFSYKANHKLLSQLAYCEETSIPYCVIIGSEEMKSGQVKIRDVTSRNEETVKRQDLTNTIKKKLRTLCNLEENK